MRIGIGAKLGILASVLIVSTGLICAWWITQTSRELTRRQAQTTLAEELLLHGETLRSAFRALENETLRQANAPELQRLLRAPAAERDRLAQSLQKSFASALRDRASLLRIEFIPYADDELPSVEASRPGMNFPSPTSLTRQFAEVKNLSDSRVLFAAIQRNNEAQKGKQPHPVYRAAVPVFLPEKGVRSVGAVVVTQDFVPVADALRWSARVLTFLTDEQGRCLLHPDPDREFAWEASRATPLLQDEMPELKALYVPGNTSEGALSRSADGSMLGRRLHVTGGVEPWQSPDTWCLLALRVKDAKAWAEVAVRDQVAETFADLTAKSPGIAASRPDEHTTTLFLRSTDAEKLRQEGRALVQRFPSLLEARSPQELRTFDVQFLRLELAPGRWLGFAQAVSHQDLEGSVMASERRSMLWLKLGLVLAVGVALAFLLARRLTRPLQRITAATRELARGNFQIDLSMHRHDEIGALAGCFKDMAEQMQHNLDKKREEEARLKAVLRTAAEGIFILDEAGRIQLLNHAAQRIFGYSDKELEGQNVKVLLPKEVQGLPGDGPAAGASAIESVRLSKLNNSTQEVVGRRKDGTTFPLELSVSDVPVGSRRIYTGIVRDITDRKKAEKDIKDLNDHLRQLNEQLDRRVQERTRQLQKANHELTHARDQAVEASRVKSVFLGQMSHEFRTPLNHIMGYAELLQEEMQDQGLHQFYADLDKILTACRNLLALIEDVLDLSSIEARQLDLNLENFDVAALLQETIAPLRPRCEANANRLDVGCPDSVGAMFADPKRVRQVLANLISNAAKFTREGDIALTARRERRGGRECIVFDVRDTGIGIAPDKLSKLFRPFSQADDGVTRRYDGSGLGLVISRGFCLIMGGDLSAVSTPGEGSTFTARLPAEVQDAAPAEATVLVIVEDDAARNSLVRVGESLGFRVLGAANGLEGLRLARRAAPVAIVLDAVLPGPEGWEILPALKGDPATARTPVLMLANAEERGLALALGADEQANRPVDRERLAVFLGQYRPGSPSRAGMPVAARG